MNRHFIFDFETIGQDVFEIPILDCSYMVFDWDRFISKPYTLEELVILAKQDKLDILHQIKEYNAKYTKRDIDWWLSQDEFVKNVLKPSPWDVTVEEFIQNMSMYLRDVGEISHWWSRSNTFDPLILQRFSKLVHRQDEIFKYLKYWSVRDTRTWIDAKLGFQGKNNGFVPIADEEYWNKTFIKHDSRYDIAADILRLQTIERLEQGLDQPQR